MEKQEILEISKRYYIRDEIAREIFNYSKNREVVPKYFDKFGKRPDTIDYVDDVKALTQKNVTSFHCSVELWKDPLLLTKDLTPRQMDQLRIGWDLLIDIDCPFLDYSREAAKLIVKALEWHGVKNYGIKFSGNKGFHIVLSHLSFPDKIRDISISKFFPEGLRVISSYIADFVEDDLREIILSINTPEEISKALKKEINALYIDGKFNPYSIINFDSMLMSNRHLYRMPYSLHEKTGLVSVVINKHQLNNFNLKIARPFSVQINNFLKKPEREEARELLLNALDWQVKEKIFITNTEAKKTVPKTFRLPALTENIEEVYCGCIKKILEGIKNDGRKRALFVLITYFRSLGFDFEKIEETIKEWNKKNYKPLKESYIKGQLNWFKKQTKIILPPNHSANLYYLDLGVLTDTCKNYKNPAAYTLKMLKEIKRMKMRKTKRLSRKNNRTKIKSMKRNKNNAES